MFTADEIREISFSRSGIGGFKPNDVEDFIIEVADDFEKLENTNKELVEKIQVLAEHIQRLRENEEAVKNSLINAQITADNVMKKANEDSQKLISDSNEKADLLIKEAERKATQLFDEAKVKSEDFLNTSIEKANNIVASAENDAISLRNEADKKVDRQRLVYEKLKAETVKFRQANIDACKKQLELLYFVSDSEKFLDKVVSTDTTNEDFSEKIVNDDVKTDEVSDKKEKPAVEIPEIDEIEESEELENQSSLFEYLS